MGRTVLNGRYTFFPREHGATAMLLAPFAASAILARTVSPRELAALLAALALYAVKDPLVALARQRRGGRDNPEETRVWRTQALVHLLVLALCSGFLLWAGPAIPWLCLGFGGVVFLSLAIGVHLRNRQRAVGFQLASAAALTSGSVVAALSATGRIPGWSPLLWLLFAAQSAAGIFTVHSRLDARIAAAKSLPNPPQTSRRAALASVTVLAVAGVAGLIRHSPAIAAGLFVAAAGYGWDLQRQKSPESLRTPLTTIGLQSLSLALVYGTLVVVGLLNY